MVIISGFQPEDEGSIPSTRVPGKVKSNWYLPGFENRCPSRGVQVRVLSFPFGVVTVIGNGSVR